MLLRYSVGDAQPFHTVQTEQASDGERMVLIAADRALVRISTIVEYCSISDLGVSRIIDALSTIKRALDLKRPRLGLAHG